MNKISFLKKIGCYPTLHYLRATSSREESDPKFISRFLNPVFNFICSIILFGITILICGISITSDLSNWVANTSMFQRSGALIVASAVYMEFAVHSCELTPHKMPGQHIWSDGVDRLYYLYKWSMPVGVGAVLLGTLIWAYGDFLISADAVCLC